MTADVKPASMAGDYKAVRFSTPVTFNGRTFDVINTAIKSDEDVLVQHSIQFLVVTWREQVRFVPWANVVDLTPHSDFVSTYMQGARAGVVVATSKRGAS